MVGNTQVDLSNADAVKSYTGLSSTDKISEALVSEAMIGSQAYSLVTVRVKDPADAEAVAKEMKEGINPAKWICVNADDLRVAASGDVVMLIMVSTALSETVTAAEIVDAFAQVCRRRTVGRPEIRKQFVALSRRMQSEWPVLKRSGPFLGVTYAVFKYSVSVLFPSGSGDSVFHRTEKAAKYRSAFEQPGVLRRGRTRLRVVDGGVHSAGVLLWTAD